MQSAQSTTEIKIIALNFSFEVAKCLGFCYRRWHSMPYPRSKKTCTFNTIPCSFLFRCKDISAATKLVRYIFLNEGLFHETRIEIDLSFKDFGSKQL